MTTTELHAAIYTTQTLLKQAADVIEHNAKSLAESHTKNGIIEDREVQAAVESDIELVAHLRAAALPWDQRHKSTERPQSRAHQFPANQVQAVRAELQEAVEAHGLTAPAQQELSNLKLLAEICPELNMSNYTIDDVDELNNWAIEVATAIDALAEQPAPVQQEPSQAAWRKLALQFDAQRMSALAHLRAMVQDPSKHIEVAREFLAAAPQPAPVQQEPVAPSAYESLTRDMTTIAARQVPRGVPIAEFAMHALADAELREHDAAPQPAQQQEQEPVGEVKRYGLDSHGRQWHGIYWYDPNVDVPHGTKLYTSPPAKQEADAIVTSLTAGPDGVARSGLDRELPLMAGVYLSPQPAQQITEAQVEAALKAAHMHSTPESRKDMRRAIEAAAPQPAQRTDDTKRLDALAENSWDLRCFDMPTGADDADIGWRVVEHHMAKPNERTVAEVFRDDPRQAIDAAIAAANDIKRDA